MARCRTWRGRQRFRPWRGAARRGRVSDVGRAFLRMLRAALAPPTKVKPQPLTLDACINPFEQLSDAAPEEPEGGLLEEAAGAALV
ncbi:hypothetical protein ACP4OV_004458 [Aristida adscensionis]